MSKRRLSKSRILSALQCPKRLYVEENFNELAEVSAATLAAFETGQLVGNAARGLLGSDKGVLVGQAQGMADAAKATAELMAQNPRVPIYEATFQSRGVTVRVDVLRPEGGGWRLIEVKASTSLKDEHLPDVAIQAWVIKDLGHVLTGVTLAHIDNTFVYQDDGNLEDLFVEHDVAVQLAEIVEQVPGWVDSAQDVAVGPEPSVEVGAHCTRPFECPFFKHCWPSEAEYPVYGLGGSKKLLAGFVNDGFRDIRDVPADRISSAKQMRIQAITASGQPELLPGARKFASTLGYPRYYLDFETVSPAVPIWRGTRPYEALPFQWSCHIESEPGQLRHTEFLDLSGDPPMRALAESLINGLGSMGPVLMYTPYERTVINGLAKRFPDLAHQLERLGDRLIDLAPVTRENFYHPMMLGSWSIKSVLPVIAPDLSYSQLDGIQDGTEASKGYLEAIHADTTPTRKAELRAQLLRYCKLDTKAMVRLLSFLAGA